MVGGGNGPCHGELSAGVHLAREDVGHGVASLLAGLPCHEDGVGIGAPRGGLDDRSAVDDHHHGLALCVERVAHVHDHLPLVLGEVELALYLAVNALAGLTANGDDGCVGILHFIVDADGADADFGVLLLSEHLHLIPACGMAVGLELCAGILHILAIDVGERLRWS